MRPPVRAAKALWLMAVCSVLSSCSEEVRFQIANNTAESIELRYGAKAASLEPGESLRLPYYPEFSIVVDGTVLEYAEPIWPPDYVHRTRCLWMMCPVVYLRFDDDRMVRILEPEQRSQTGAIETQPDGFPLKPR